MTGRRPYTRHGLHAIKAKVKVAGLAAIDGRTAAAQALLEWRRDLVADLGGDAVISAQQRALVELATRTRLYVDHLDAFLMAQRSLVHAKRKAVLPVLRERQALADSLARILSLLGLERVVRRATDLTAYIQQRYVPPTRTCPTTPPFHESTPTRTDE
jgi:hypothetical protein